jgi:hypothetical protein
MSTPAQNPVVNQSTTAAAAAPVTALPHPKTLLQAAKFAIEKDRAILLDYYLPTMNDKAFLGEDPKTKERILYKSAEEFTSLISNFYNIETDFIALTENSIYIVSGKIKRRKVDLAELHGAFDS